MIKLPCVGITHGLAEAMGKRGGTESPIPVSARVQSLVEQAKAAHGLAPQQPVATPTRIRAKSRPLVEPAELDAAKTPSKPANPSESHALTPARKQPSPLTAKVQTPGKQPSPSEPKAAATPGKTTTKETPAKPVQTPGKQAAMDMTPVKTPALKAKVETPAPMSVQSTLSTPMRSPDHKRVKLAGSNDKLRPMPSFDSWSDLSDPPSAESGSKLRHVDTQSTRVLGMDSLSLRL